MKNKNKASTAIRPSKHGVHLQPGTERTLQSERKTATTDPEDPLSGEPDAEQLPWETEDERILRDESEDPDEPKSL